MKFRVNTWQRTYVDSSIGQLGSSIGDAVANTTEYIEIREKTGLYVEV
jgi:hypothetical protein